MDGWIDGRMDKWIGESIIEWIQIAWQIYYKAQISIFSLALMLKSSSFILVTFHGTHLHVR